MMPYRIAAQAPEDPKPCPICEGVGQCDPAIHQIDKMEKLAKKASHWANVAAALAILGAVLNLLALALRRGWIQW